MILIIQGFLNCLEYIWSPHYLPETDNPSDYGRIYPIRYYNPQINKWNTINSFQYPTPSAHSAAGINLDVVARPSKFDAPYFIERQPLRRYVNIKDLDWESDEPQNTPTPSPSKYRHRRPTWNWRDDYVIRGGRVFKKTEKDFELRPGTSCSLVSVH